MKSVFFSPAFLPDSLFDFKREEVNSGMLEQSVLFSLPSTQQDETVQREHQVDLLTEQPVGSISFGGGRYLYDGFALQGKYYVPWHLAFTPDEAGVFADCDLLRVRLMVDSVGRSAIRQAEIQKYGKRCWHSIVRPEPACEQGLDWAFGHHVARVAYCQPYLEQLFREDSVQADRWIHDLRSAYIRWCQGERDGLYRVLRQAGVPISERAASSYSLNATSSGS